MKQTDIDEMTLTDRQYCLTKLMDECQKYLQTINEGLVAPIAECNCLSSETVDSQIYSIRALFDSLPEDMRTCTQDQIDHFARQLADTRYKDSPNLIENMDFSQVWDDLIYPGLGQYEDMHYIELPCPFNPHGIAAIRDRACLDELTGKPMNELIRAEQTQQAYFNITLRSYPHDNTTKIFFEWLDNNPEREKRLPSIQKEILLSSAEQSALSNIVEAKYDRQDKIARVISNGVDLHPKIDQDHVRYGDKYFIIRINLDRATEIDNIILRANLPKHFDITLAPDFSRNKCYLEATVGVSINEETKKPEIASMRIDAVHPEKGSVMVPFKNYERDDIAKGIVNADLLRTFKGMDSTKQAANKSKTPQTVIKT